MMQSPTTFQQPTGPAQAQETRQRLAVMALPVVVILLAGLSFFWLQWAGQRGVTMGYPMPAVQIAPLPSTTLRLHEPNRFTAQGTGRDLTYTWHFTSSAIGNGGNTGDMTRQGQSITLSFESNGAYTVTVTVTDPVGHTSSNSMQVQVMPLPPVASFTYQVTAGFFGTNVNVDASASKADPSTSIATYSWDFGDGNGPETYYSAMWTHTYYRTGTYTITLTVIDALGQKSQPVSQKVKIS